jgi:AcrR family transcriptional regulator
MEVGVKGRRGYHSPLRAEQATETRRRVLAAARSLFLARGYAGTTVAAVAEAAGVSPDTIYVSLGGKRGLLEGVVSVAIFDPDDPVQVDQERRREQINALPDPRERLRGLVHLSCERISRTSPVHAVIRGAADGQPFAAELREKLLRQRLEIQGRNVGDCIGSVLRAGVTAREAAESYSALLNPELHHLLTVECRWSAHKYETWVVAQLERCLLG